MNFQKQRPTDQMDDRYKDVIQEIPKIDPFCNVTEEFLLTQILAETFEEEKSLDPCREILGLKTKGMSQENLETLRRKLDQLKSDISKAAKEDFKKNVKELCGVDVFHESVSMHLPGPRKEQTDTALHQETERMLAYMIKKGELAKMLPAEFKSLKKIQEDKGPNSERARRRRKLNLKMAELIQESNDVTSTIGQIERGLRSLNRASKVAYAKIIEGNFDNIKARLFALVEKRNDFEMELKKYIRDGQRSLKCIPDYIDDYCEICSEKEKDWDYRWAASKLYDPLRVKDARNFHTRMVRSGGMRGLVDQFKSLLTYGSFDPDIALPSVVCSMTDPKRADKLYKLISENNFLKDFRHSLLQNSEKEILHKNIRIDCMECGVAINRCSF